MTYLNREGVIWSSARVTGNPLDKAVLVCIGKRVNKHWAAFPSYAEIARETEIAEATIPKCIRRLERGGHLVRVSFTAASGADQKVGFVLGGCGLPLDSLDDDFLDLAFADRKQPGTPRVAKPQHWSGERKEGRVAHSHPPRVAHSHPGGGSQPPLEVKNKKEDQKEQEEAFGEAAVPAAQQQDQAAVAEARAAAPAPNRDHQVATESKIPTQRQRQDRRSPIRKRDDDWRVQIAAARRDFLQYALDEYELEPGSQWKWAEDTAGHDMGLESGMEWDGREDEQFRAAYLYLLKRHADDDKRLDILLDPLDGSLASPEPEYEWIEYCYTPSGMTSEAFAEQMRKTIRGMDEEQWGPQIAEIRKVKPGVWAECRQAAKEYLRARKITIKAASMNVVAMQLAINRYEPKGKWPAAFVPPSIRTPAQSEPPAWAA